MSTNSTGNVRCLCRMMDSRPQDFRREGYTLVHVPSGVEIWVGTGILFYGFSVYETDIPPFRFWERFMFHRALKRWRRASSAPITKSLWARLGVKK